MRIIAGKFKGRVLNDFSHEGTRPTGDKARGGIFNTLVYEIEDAVVLDLFGGTGALGIESESRGADTVYIVDNNPSSIKTILSNCKLCGATKIKVMQRDYTKALEEFEKKGIKFDIIFLDPPYKENYGEIAMKMIYKMNLLSPYGVICYEHDGKKIVENVDFILEKSRKYGIATVDYYRLNTISEEREDE